MDSDDRSRCTARSKQSGERCKRAPSPGLSVCVSHGAKTPAARAKAERVLALERAEREVSRLGLRRSVSPSEALQEALERAAGDLTALEQQVQHLGADAVKLGPMGPQRSEWVRLYHETTERLARIAKAAGDAGVAERQVAVAEAQVAMFAGALQRILQGLQLTPAQAELAAVVVPRELAALEAAPAVA